MKKNVNLIIYKPGYGGHFIQFLLSLDKSTVPCINKDTTFTQIHNLRKDYYSFKNLRKTYGRWVNHHKLYDGMNIDELIINELTSNSLYNTANIQAHPAEFYAGLHDYLLNYNLVKDYIIPMSTNYMQVEVSPKYEYVIDLFKICNGNFPKLRPNEEELNQKFTKDYSPYIINFDNFILGEEYFIEEYTKLNNHLQLPLYLDDALELYHDWYNERRFSQYLGVGSEI